MSTDKNAKESERLIKIRKVHKEIKHHEWEPAETSHWNLNSNQGNRN